jgi:hypothetical protein
MTEKPTEQYTSQNFLLCGKMGYNSLLVNNIFPYGENRSVCTLNGVLLGFLSEETDCGISSVPASITTLSDGRLLGQMMV